MPATIMSDVFFQELEMPRPDFNLGVGSGSPRQQTAGIMLELEPVILETKPDLVLVYGDVNSTLAAALVCLKLGIRVGHVASDPDQSTGRHWRLPVLGSARLLLLNCAVPADTAQPYRKHTTTRKSTMCKRSPILRTF